MNMAKFVFEVDEDIESFRSILGNCAAGLPIGERRRGVLNKASRTLTPIDVVDESPNSVKIEVYVPPPDPVIDARTWLAGQALGGWITALAARSNEPGYDDKYATRESARLARHTADALLAELAKETQP